MSLLDVTLNRAVARVCLLGLGGVFFTSELAAKPREDGKEMSEARKKRSAVFSKRYNMNDAKSRAEAVAAMRKADGEQRRALRRIAKARGLVLEGKKPDGREFRLIDFDENGLPVYEQSENVNAAISTATDRVRSSRGYGGVDGSSVTIGLWEAGGVPRTGHQELFGRVTVMDGTTTVSGHATHVAGTLAATGINPDVEGMAPEAKIAAFGAGGASAEMLANGASAPNTDKLYLSNHSYGTGQGWEDDSWRGVFSDDGDPSNDVEPDFGRYAFRSQDWDEITYSLPYYLVFVSSGNQKNDGPPRAGDEWTYNGTTYLYDPSQHPQGDGDYKDNYDNMEGGKLAKNVISVGAVADAVTNGSRDVSRAVTRNFSSRGPADDGRIKPDIVANGASLLSSDSDSNTDTGTRSGTSMSSPNACGSAALLVDYFSNRFPNQAMRASTLRGLILHTADDRGNPGPDYKYGWGLMNTQAAADVIREHADKNGDATLLESSLSARRVSREHHFVWDGNSPLRVTLCWTDPAGTQKTGHDNRERTLVNDLNLSITGPDGTHYPYVMPHVGDWSVDTIEDDAVTGVNTVDNTEQVYLVNPVAGDYVITVNYAGALTNGVQDYSLIATGHAESQIELVSAGPPEVTLVDNSGLQDFGSSAPSEASVERNFTVRNVGGSPLTNLTLDTLGASAADFTASSFSVTELGIGEESSFSVRYEPSGVGTRTAALRLDGNGASESLFGINLSAIGLSELERWRSEHFGTTANTGDGADDFDYDEDGLANLLEFGLGTLPRVAEASPISLAVEGSNVEVSYPRNVLAMSDFLFEVSWSDTLSGGDWSTGEVTESILSDDGIAQEVEAAFDLEASSKRFFRLQMSEK